MTVILDQAVNPQITPLTSPSRSQLVLDFPQVRPGRLPDNLPGDGVLVKNVKTETSATGVRIILDMYPERPYVMEREITPLKARLAMFRLNLRADPAAPDRQPPPPASPTPPPAPAPTEPPPAAAPPPRAEIPPPTPPPGEPPAAPYSGPAPSGAFAELAQLIPQAKGLWGFLQSDGWTVAGEKKYDSPGPRDPRSFNLTNSRYPEMRVRIAHVPPSGGAPSINIVDLAMDNLTGKAVDDYRKLRTWSFGQIKTKYEDIGDFFEDALKPLRVEIRKKSQDIAQRHAQFITKFLQQAVPQNPRLGDEAMTLIRKKVSPRFEGVQYTLSDNPLTILNLVDFLYIRVYYLSR
ncbi:MAG: hypothetical protein WAU47_05460 [Desulfobaccales bacterium]